MALSKLILLVFLFNIGYSEQVKIQCSNSFSTKNTTDLCYYNNQKVFSWSDAYNQCLSRMINGILIQIFSNEQFNLLKNANIDETSLFWLGANNFASFYDSHWHWLDGSIVDSSVITWCPNSTYKTAIGTYCAAYDSTLQCVNNYLCNTLLPVPCVSAANGINRNAKISLISQPKATGLCGSSSGDSYANWWTYSILLLNWFILFCFFLYLCNRFTITKNTMILISIIIILSFVLIIIYAILWSVQYQDIIQIPLAIVIIGCIACTLLFIVLFIVLNDRNRVQRFMACMILIFSTIVLECFLMLGLILCIAYCSAYITLSWTSLDKDVTASVLASLIAAISVLLYTGVLYLLENDGYDRIHAVKPVHTNTIPLASTQHIAPPPPPPPQSHNNAHSNNHRPNSVIPIKKHEQIERATSPVDERILEEFYTDRPKDIHQYSLEGKNYVVYERTGLTDLDSYRKDLTQAMLLQESQGLNDAIDRAKGSIHASNLSDEINQAQSLATKLP
ncbi:unnamed protein product [Rotaria sp. Silwood2]|nr:unnamed protein product [Rotaria sp. Silwood2]CAF2529052.1 unnamed protein product [Rotaria sp. Silwood2]CAF2762528.1 unnamed protein product [Rotaria sp. Silwood2]CAF2940099.1 unnamed protein product [Rotaria sp. Silwood2]CAF3850564.1 unnamed protein product [Rotaria sp. Silwood2]